MAENNLNLQFHFIDWLVTALTLSQTAGKHTENSTALHTARGSVTHYTQNKTHSVQRKMAMCAVPLWLPQLHSKNWNAVRGAMHWNILRGAWI